VFGNHRDEAPVLIKGKALIVDCRPAVGVHVPKLSPHTNPVNRDALERYLRTIGLIERERDFGVPMLICISTSAWADRSVSLFVGRPSDAHPCQSPWGAHRIGSPMRRQQ